MSFLNTIVISIKPHHYFWERLKRNAWYGNDCCALQVMTRLNNLPCHLTGENAWSLLDVVFGNVSSPQQIFHLRDKKCNKNGFVFYKCPLVINLFGQKMYWAFLEVKCIKVLILVSPLSSRKFGIYRMIAFIFK